MDGKLPQKSNFLTPQRQPYFPPRPYHSTLNLDLLDSMFQKLQMSSKVFKSNKIEDKVQLQNTFQPKVIKFNSGQELFMGLRVNRPLPISQNLNSSPKEAHRSYKFSLSMTSNNFTISFLLSSKINACHLGAIPLDISISVANSNSLYAFF